MATSVLVTGGAGFIGHNFINYLLTKHRHQVIISLDKAPDERRKLMASYRPKNKTSSVVDVDGDIANRELVMSLLMQFQVSTVYHFAAESHVDRSIDGPLTFMENNCMGTFSLLQCVHKYVEQKPPAGFAFINVSTDEVYGSTTERKVKLFTEDDVLSPSNPYSASKAAAEMACIAFYKTYKFPVIITRCCNNYGPFQMPEKLVPLMISNAAQDKPLPVYGSGKQEREWLHVNDHAKALVRLAKHGKDGQIYNIGSRVSFRNVDLVKRIKKLVGSKSQIKHVQDRPGHDLRYAISPAKLEVMGWEPEISAEEGLQKTVDWYLANGTWVAQIEALQEFTRERVGLNPKLEANG